MAQQILHDDVLQETATKFFNKGVHTIPSLRRPINGKPNKTLLLVGETGSGKTTTLNSMMNYLFDVEFYDPYRYKLIDEKTDDVSAYYLEPPDLPYQVTLINTPGFGQSVKRNEQITKQIKKFFETKVDSIDAVCFVIPASVSRLTPTQKQIFALFGKDLMQNILVLCTFADGSKPSVLSALKEAKVPFRDYFQVDNTGFDLPKDSGYALLAKMFWNMGMNAFENLFDEIEEMDTKSLDMTRQVLNERERLINEIDNYCSDGCRIKECLDTLSNISICLCVTKEDYVYIDNLIEYEELIERPGYQHRVLDLKKLKKRQQVIIDIYKN